MFKRKQEQTKVENAPKKVRGRKKGFKVKREEKQATTGLVGIKQEKGFLPKELKPIDIMKRALSVLKTGKGNREHDGLIIFSNHESGASVYAHASKRDWNDLLITMINNDMIDIPYVLTKIEIMRVNSIFEKEGAESALSHLMKVLK